MMDTFYSVSHGWKIIGKIGEGSFGVVYEAEREVTGYTEKAAIKYISVPKNESELNAIYAELGTKDRTEVNSYLNGVQKTIVAEYYQMKEFQGNTNIVSCNDIEVVEKKDMPGYDVYIWMELLESLSNRIIDGKTGREETIKIGIDICNALVLLAKKGIVHRDIKPQNIFVNNDGDYKLGDFGTARSIKGTSSIMSMKGTFSYMSPEVMLRRPVNFKADIYSLGMVMYRLMNKNKAPFMLSGQTTNSILIEESDNRRFAGERLPAPAEADEELAKIILKACEYETEKRWQNAELMRDALLNLIGTNSTRRYVTEVFYYDQNGNTVNSEKHAVKKLTRTVDTVAGKVINEDWEVLRTPSYVTVVTYYGKNDNIVHNEKYATSACIAFVTLLYTIAKTFQVWWYEKDIENDDEIYIIDQSIPANSLVLAGTTIKLQLSTKK